MTNLDALWVTPQDIYEELSLDTIDPDDEDALRDYEAALAACEFASQTLWTLSGRKFHTGRASSEQYLVDFPSSVVTAAQARRYQYNSDLGAFLVAGKDWESRKIRLDGTPVVSVSSVTDVGSGRLLKEDEYHIVNRAFLHISGPISRGVEVTYEFGQKPPTAGRMAALALARQFFYLWSGREDECTLPDRVTSVTRQNVSWVLLDNQDFLDDLKTGVYAVDLFLRTVNPDKARVKAKVFSVDLPRGRRRSF